MVGQSSALIVLLVFVACLTSVACPLRGLVNSALVVILALGAHCVTVSGLSIMIARLRTSLSLGVFLLILSLYICVRCAVRSHAVYPLVLLRDANRATHLLGLRNWFSRFCFQSCSVQAAAS